MAQSSHQMIRILLLGASLTALTACGSGGFDFDLRNNLTGGFDTSDAVRQRTETRPAPDDRGVISYPSFQVAIARRGDTVADVAGRVGLDAAALARYNGIPLGAQLRRGEVVALPSRVAESASLGQTPGDDPTRSDDRIDISTLAGTALDRADQQAPPFRSTPTPQTGREPIQHQVERGETAYSIARLYQVSVRALADWNGLGPDLTVREGQFLLIPIVAGASGAIGADASAPGAGSLTPEPPSASQPLPPVDESPAASLATPPSPNLSGDRTAASGQSRLLLPVTGKIIRTYQKGQNDGIDIAAAAGTPVQAAAEGTVAAITRDTDQVPILVLRHDGNLLTVYANIEAISVEKGARVARGQSIAKVRTGSPSFLHFEVRQGFDSVDPVAFVN